MSEHTHTQGAQAYMQAVLDRLMAIRDSESAAIERAANAIADAIADGGMVYLFGTGHSHMLAEEGHFRAGGFAAVCPILTSSLMLHESAEISTRLERTSGVGPAILSRYQPSARDVLVIFSNSGVNMVPVETAQEAKRIGLTVIAVISKDYAAQIPTGPAGAKLADIADVVLDNHGIPGDALVALEEGGLRVGPLSTIAGAFLLNAVLAEAACLLQVRGIKPPIFISANMPGAKEHNARLIAEYRTRNPHL